MTPRTFHHQQGIALGPILFIIAILAIIAAAIAAGSGSFNDNTNVETIRMQASSLIQIGDNLRDGMDKLVVDAGLDPVTGTTLDPTVTTGTNALFSPQGGAVIPPSNTMANVPNGASPSPPADCPHNTRNTNWFYVKQSIPGFGTASGSVVMAVLNISQALCDQINLETTNVIAENYGVNIGMIGQGYGGNPAGQCGWEVPSAWPTPFQGKTVGCVYDTNPNTGWPGYYFYQVLAVD